MNDQVFQQMEQEIGIVMAQVSSPYCWVNLDNGLMMGSWPR